jgi:hypothetical protein
MREGDFERGLDAALARYAAVEPRAGLEQRVLAGLRARDVSVGRFEWQRWMATVVAVTAVAVAVVIWAGRKPALVDVPRVAVHETVKPDGSVPAAIANTGSAIVTVQEHAESKPITMRAQRRSGRQVARVNGELVPKLAQFPAPEPFTEQEELLVRYVEQSPEDAALVAEAMNVETERELDEMKALNKRMESEQEP